MRRILSAAAAGGCSARRWQIGYDWIEINNKAIRGETYEHDE
jgi:hypothetical protein